MKPYYLLFCSLLALAATVIVYALGVWNGHIIDLRPLTTICPGKPPAHPTPYSASAFPLSYRCLWQDGTSKELVPGYVNPLVVAFLAVAVCCAALALITAARRREVSTEAPGGVRPGGRFNGSARYGDPSPTRGSSRPPSESTPLSRV